MTRIHDSPSLLNDQTHPGEAGRHSTALSESGGSFDYSPSALRHLYFGWLDCITSRESSPPTGSKASQCDQMCSSWPQGSRHLTQLTILIE